MASLFSRYSDQEYIQIATNVLEEQHNEDDNIFLGMGSSHFVYIEVFFFRTDHKSIYFVEVRLRFIDNHMYEMHNTSFRNMTISFYVDKKFTFEIRTYRYPLNLNFSMDSFVDIIFPCWIYLKKYKSYLQDNTNQPSIHVVEGEHAIIRFPLSVWSSLKSRYGNLEDIINHCAKTGEFKYDYAFDKIVLKIFGE